MTSTLRLTAKEIARRSGGPEDFNFFDRHEFQNIKGHRTSKIVGLNRHYVWIKHSEHGRTWQERSADMSQSFDVFPATPLKPGDIS